MEITKRLTRAHRVMLASPVLAPAVRRSLSQTLARVAEHAPDGDRREAAARALEVLTAGDWGEAAWAALGVRGRTHYARSLAFSSLDRAAGGA